MSDFGIRGKSCPECPRDTLAVLDESTADFTCTGCGLVLEERCIDEGREWRNFASEGVSLGDSGAHNSNARADTHGGSMDDFSFDCGTSMAGGDAMSSNLIMYQRWASRDPAVGGDEARKDQRHIRMCCTKLRELADRMDLLESIVARGEEILRELQRRDLLPRKINNQLAWFSAIVYLACREEQVGREIRELAHIAVPGGDQKKTTDLMKQIPKHAHNLSVALSSFLRHPQTIRIPPEEVMSRYVSKLQLSQAVVSPAIHITKQAYSQGLVGAHKHLAVIANSIFIVAWLLNIEQKPSHADIAAVAKIPQASVTDAYKTLHPAVGRLLPDTFRCSLPGGAKALPSPGK